MKFKNESNLNWIYHHFSSDQVSKWWFDGQKSYTIYYSLKIKNTFYTSFFFVYSGVWIYKLHMMVDFYQEFFSFFFFIYVTIQDRGDIIGYYYSTLGDSFVPCFSCRKQQENNMFCFSCYKTTQKTTTLFSCRKHKKKQEWNRRSQPMFKSISVWLLRLMSGSCHSDRASNDEVSVEFWIPYFR